MNKFRRYVKTSWPERLEEIFQVTTVLRSKDLELRGLNRGQIQEALNHGMERIGRGLYTWTKAQCSEHHSLVQAAKRVPTGVICLLSALRFHDLTSQSPHEVWMAIGAKARLPQPGNPTIRTVRFGAEQFDLGLETHEVEHAELRVYSVARTVVDLFRYRNKIGIDVALEALKEGWQERRFSMKEINHIAASCRMARVMKPYLESLTS
jgi:predicted transcriptional regulator of viral defense system